MIVLFEFRRDLFKTPNILVLNFADSRQTWVEALLVKLYEGLIEHHSQ